MVILTVGVDGMSLTIYHYDSGNGEYLGKGIACEDPLEAGRFLVPAHATMEAPPEVREHVCAVWRGADGWVLEPDWRGGVWWDTVTGEKREIKEIGQAPGEGWTTLERVDTETEWDGELGGWVLPLEVLRRRKIAEVRGCADGAAAGLKAAYSQAEFETWGRQEAGALALAEDMEASGPDAAFVRSLAEARGVELGVMVAKILAAVGRAVVPGAEIIGKQQRLEDAILTAGTRDELEAIKW